MEKIRAIKSIRCSISFSAEFDSVLFSKAFHCFSNAGMQIDNVQK